MEWGPAVSEEVTRLARPPERGRTESVVSPSRKLTEPVGAFPDPATVATRVTAWPVVDGLMDELRVVVEAAVPAVVTVWVTTGEVEPAYVESPLYTAVMGWSPTLRVVVLRLERPPETGRVASRVAPSLKSTVPPGEPPEPLTVATRLTACPCTEGLSDERSAAWVWVSMGAATAVTQITETAATHT